MGENYSKNDMESGHEIDMWKLILICETIISFIPMKVQIVMQVLIRRNLLL